jgi:hypothetical protein
VKAIFPLLTGLLLSAGCATPPVNYYYGHYSQTLYHSKKDNTPASLAKHRQTLEDIIHTSEKKGSKVPPGIYCEYAYLLANDGSPDADRYFSLEVKTYPESAKFVGFVRSQIKSGSSTAPTTK